MQEPPREILSEDYEVSFGSLPKGEGAKEGDGDDRAGRIGQSKVGKGWK